MIGKLLYGRQKLRRRPGYSQMICSAYTGRRINSLFRGQNKKENGIADGGQGKSGGKKKEKEKKEVGTEDLNNAYGERCQTNI